MSEPMAYIARKPCGCVVFVTVDDERYKQDTAKEIAECIREGLTVERVTCEAVRDGDFGCKCEPKQMAVEDA